MENMARFIWDYAGQILLGGLAIGGALALLIILMGYFTFWWGKK